MSKWAGCISTGIFKPTRAVFTPRLCSHRGLKFAVYYLHSVFLGSIKLFEFLLTSPSSCDILLVVADAAAFLRSCAVSVASAAFLYLPRSVDIFDALVYIISRDISIRCGATAFGSSSRSCGRDVCFYIIIALVSARGCEKLCFLYSACKCFAA